MNKLLQTLCEKLYSPKWTTQDYLKILKDYPNNTVLSEKYYSRHTLYNPPMDYEYILYKRVVLQDYIA